MIRKKNAPFTVEIRREKIEAVTSIAVLIQSLTSSSSSSSTTITYTIMPSSLITTLFCLAPVLLSEAALFAPALKNIKKFLLPAVVVKMIDYYYFILPINVSFIF